MSWTKMLRLRATKPGIKGGEGFCFFGLAMVWEAVVNVGDWQSPRQDKVLGGLLAGEKPRLMWP